MIALIISSVIVLICMIIAIVMKNPIWLFHIYLLLINIVLILNEVGVLE